MSSATLPRASRLRRLVNTGMFAMALLAAGPSAAANLIPAAFRPNLAAPLTTPLIVRDDHGGQIVQRAREVEALRRSGRDVRIVGSVCYSSCTMLVGLPEACVSRDTVFGFHGPSRSGQRLDRARFERASALIAAHYPAPLRNWYMATARHELRGLHRMTGADLIRMGVRACA